MKADLVSGFEGSVFLTSVIVEVVKEMHLNERFKIAFWGGVCDIRSRQVKEYVRKDFFDRETKKILALAKEDPSYFKKRAELIQEKGREFEEYARKIIKSLPNRKDDELPPLYQQAVRKICGSYSLGGLTFIYESAVSEMLAQSLAKRYPAPAELLNHILEVPYKSFMLESEEMLRKISHSPSRELIEGYKERFFYIRTNYFHAPILTREDVIGMASSIHTPPHKHPEYSLTPEEKTLAELLRHSLIIRDVRKRINLIGGYMMFRFLEEVSRRESIPVEKLQNAFWFELFSRPANLEKRRVCTMYIDQGKTGYEQGNLIEESSHAGESLKGLPASLGKVQGRVCIIQGQRDFSRMKENGILVTYATRPDFLPVMKKAKAILTQEGSITSHAAIVARELHIPCVVGIPSLISSLKDGDNVEVDATEGRVRHI